MGASPVMVTGGCGFVGAALTGRLARDGSEVVVLDDHRLGNPANVAAWGPTDNVTFAVVNLEDPRITRRVIEQYKPRTIYHLAAKHFIPECNRDPHGTVSANVAGTQSLLDACRELVDLETLVIASSAAVYAPGPGPHDERESPKPIDIYGLSKLWNEQQAVAFHELRRGEVGIGVARLFNVFGPGETNEHLIPAIVRQGLEGDTVSLGNLDTCRDYVFVEDVVDALLRFPEVTRGGGFEVCNIGTGEMHDGHRLVEAVASVLGRKLTVRTDPERFRRSDRPFLLSEISRAEAVLGWTPHVGLTEGIERSVARPLGPRKVVTPAPQPPRDAGRRLRVSHR